MTESEWLACTDPQKMLGHLGERASERKLRLFACACCRRIWHLLKDRRSREAVEAVGRFADGLAPAEERATANFAALQAAEAAARAYDEGPPRLREAAAAEAAADAALAAVGPVHLIHAVVEDAVDAARLSELHPADDPLGAIERAAQAALLCDLFSPFRPVTIAPACLTPQVVALAQAAYEQRELPAGTLDLARLAVVADALEDAGCDQADLLGHLRGPGPHVRGCWAVDLLLGKE